ncbi:MAG: patatin-like phospholipase family protein [Halioglobus sp.]
MSCTRSSLAFLWLSMITVCPVAAQEEDVALVLAGGGARGIAHVGAITALEELQVPISAIAGTSMGALVGGLYAIGLDSHELLEVVENMSWDEAFEDSLERDDLPQRRKSDDYDYPSSISLALNDGNLSIPLGFVQGQQVRQMIKDLTLDADHIDDFDTLPTPFRAVATDIETGDPYIFSQGDIVTAMRASMSLPGLLAPVEHDGRLLVDGGLAMNIPVSVGREMGADRLIVIDIGTPLRDRENINSLLDVGDQMLNFLTRKNSLEQLDLMTEHDLLINPDLQGIGMLDFENTQEIFRRGYEATMALAQQLAPLALNDADWANYLASREMASPGNPMIDHIAIFDDSPLRDDIIRVRLSQQTGEPLDRDQLRADMAEIYALDQWQIIDYDVVLEEGRGNVLQIHAKAKTWGSDDLKFGLNLVTDLDGGSEINLGVSYLWKGLTDMGGELYARSQIGDTLLFSAEFYQPLDLRSRFFVVPYVGYHDYDVTTLGPEYSITDPAGIWRVRRLSTQLDAGWNALENTQLRLGLFRNKGEYRSDIEFGGALPEDNYDEGGAMLSVRYDKLDNAYFPTRGGFFYGDYRALREEMGSDEDFERWQAIAQGAFTFGAEDRNTIILTGRTGQSVNATNTPQNYFQLGGLFNLSGVSQNYFSGRQMAFAMAQYQHRLSDTSVLPFDMPAYVGASLEGGELWSDRSDVSSGDFITAGSIYLAVDTPIGPMYFAYGRTEDSQDALYLALGWPFLNNQLRIGR